MIIFSYLSGLHINRQGKAVYKFTVQDEVEIKKKLGLCSCWLNQSNWVTFMSWGLVNHMWNAIVKVIKNSGKWTLENSLSMAVQVLSHSCYGGKSCATWQILLCTMDSFHRLYRVSQEECARLRESVPYVKVYRYNPKHLISKVERLRR
jgi:hypothetical protein